MKKLIQKLKPIKLEGICNGEYTYYDKVCALRCGKLLSYKNVFCGYLSSTYCTNEFYTPKIIEYIKK